MITHLDTLTIVKVSNGRVFGVEGWVVEGGLEGDGFGNVRTMKSWHQMQEGGVRGP